MLLESLIISPGIYLVSLLNRIITRRSLWIYRNLLHQPVLNRLKNLMPIIPVMGTNHLLKLERRGIHFVKCYLRLEIVNFYGLVYNTSII